MARHGLGRAVALVATAIAIVSCDPGRGTAFPSGASGQLITILAYQPSPSPLEATPGSTVQVQNLDTVLHSVTSEASLGALVPGAAGGVAFDTGPFTGTRAFAIPADTAPGTVIPYYCQVHARPDEQGTIRVVATPTP